MARKSKSRIKKIWNKDLKTSWSKGAHKGIKIAQCDHKFEKDTDYTEQCIFCGITKAWMK